MLKYKVAEVHSDNRAIEGYGYLRVAVRLLEKRPLTGQNHPRSGDVLTAQPEEPGENSEASLVEDRRTKAAGNAGCALFLYLFINPDAH